MRDREQLYSLAINGEELAALRTALERLTVDDYDRALIAVLTRLRSARAINTPYVYSPGIETR